jgi:diguanylate cyclase (GGDEF)-like protein
MKTILNFLDLYSSGFVSRWSFILILILISISLISGGIIFFEPFFFIPLVLISWHGSKKEGILSSAFTSSGIALCYKVSDAIFLGYLFTLYSFISHFVAYSLVVFFVTNFRKVHHTETTAADTDYLTGLLNPRGFYTELANELVRSVRYNHIFSLAYMDIDDFKIINDTFGHSAGDKVLIAVAQCLKKRLRDTDKIARLGGDEYAWLLTETGMEGSKKSFIKIKEELESKMKSRGWNVKFSIGIVTFEKCPEDVKEAVKIADDLMYSVKKNKKNNIAYKIWKGKV